MKKLDVSPISDTSQMPLKKGTLEFLQEAYGELFKAIAETILGSTFNAAPQKLFILNGCKNTGIGSNYIVSAGVVYYQGEIYFVDASSFIISGGNAPWFNLSTSQYQLDADPVTFSDSAVRSIHNIRKMVLGANTSGVSTFVDARKTLNSPFDVYTTNASEIANETELRENADFTLQQNIEQEVTTRENADIVFETQLGNSAIGMINFQLPYGDTIYIASITPPSSDYYLVSVNFVVFNQTTLLWDQFSDAHTYAAHLSGGDLNKITIKRKDGVAFGNFDFVHGAAFFRHV